MRVPEQDKQDDACDDMQQYVSRCPKCGADRLIVGPVRNHRYPHRQMACKACWHLWDVQGQREFAPHPREAQRAANRRRILDAIKIAFCPHACTPRRWRGFVAQLTRDLQLSRRTVSQHIVSLEADGEIWFAEDTVVLRCEPVSSAKARFAQGGETCADT